jgi:hypothetical protein
VTTNIETPLPLDPVPRSKSTVAPMATDDALRKQDWGRILAQLTNFAWKFTGKRSWEHAEELAQEAIADAFARVDGWDPAKEELIAYLCRQVCGLAANSWRRKRNTFEVAMRAAVKAHGVSHDGGRKELDVASGEEAADEVLDRLRLAEAYRARLTESLAGDETALAVIALFKEGVDSQTAQAERIGLTPSQISQIHAARRRVFRHAESVSKELAEELDSEETEEASEVSP